MTTARVLRWAARILWTIAIVFGIFLLAFWFVGLTLFILVEVL